MAWEKKKSDIWEQPITIATYVKEEPVAGMQIVVLGIFTVYTEVVKVFQEKATELTEAGNIQEWISGSKTPPYVLRSVGLPPYLGDNG